MRRAVPVLALAALAVVMAVTARPVEAGAGWRVAFVVVAVLGAPLAWWASRVVRPTVWGLVGVGLLLRLLVLPLQPSLSDDGYRYLWDGALTLDGRSPYAQTPRQSVEDGFTPPVPLERLNSPDYASVYPPVSQAVFATAMWLGESFGVAWVMFKLLVVGIEIGGLFALSRRLPASGLALYAWHPVAVMEVAGQGHTEGLVIGLLSVCLAVLLAKREGVAGGWLALAGWVKLWPFALMALLGVRKPRFYLALLIVASMGAAPWVGGADLEGVRASLGLYGGTFDFYSAPYLLLKSGLWWLVGDSAGPLAAAGLAGASLCLIAVIAIKQSTYRLAARIGLGAVSLVLLSTTLHPWHLLPALWGGVLAGGRLRLAAVWLVSFAPLTYLSYVGVEWSMGAALILGWGGAATVLVLATPSWLERVLESRGRSKWTRIRSLVATSEPSKVLDLGCAEGYVGAAAARDGHEVVLADLEQDRPFDLPFIEVDEDQIPLPRDSVDLTLLVFVLHHAEDAAAVLSEANRVSASRVVVWESVPGRLMPLPLLEWIDTKANALRPHTKVRPARLQTVEQWEALFETFGMRILQRRRWGTVHPQALWVLERRQDLCDRPVR